MKTQKTNKLAFGKNAITELNDHQTMAVNGGCQWSNSSGHTTIKFSIVRPTTDVLVLK